MSEITSRQVTIQNLSKVDLASKYSDDLVCGFSDRDSLVPTVYYYDDRGSEIFQELCLEESYYLPKAELRILTENASSIAEAIGGKTIIELGCGDCHKTIVLLQEVMTIYGKCKFIPIDVSDYIIEQASSIITDKVSGIEVEAICGTYDEAITYLGGKNLSASVYTFLGSTMAQFTNKMISDFLNLLRNSAKSGDLFLVGFDLYKSIEKLRTPYNTKSAIAHQLNALHPINRIYDGNFNSDVVQCEGRWNEKMKQIEMTLTFTEDQLVNLKKLEFSHFFSTDEETITHIMRKMERHNIVKIFMNNGMKAKVPK